MNNFLVDLIKLYESNDYEVQSSLSPLHFPGFNHAQLPFSYIYQNGELVCRGGGLAISELMFVDSIASIMEPKNNRLVMFPSGTEHYVQPFSGKRVSLVVNPWDGLKYSYPES